MTARTVFLSKLIGLYLILIAIPMAANQQATIATVEALVHSAPLLFVVGLILVAVGLALILSHNIWSGGALPVIVTLIGWLTLLKGLLFLFLPPPEAVGVIIWGKAYEQFFYADVAIVFLLGVYLTYAGFRPAAGKALRVLDDRAAELQMPGGRRPRRPAMARCATRSRRASATIPRCVLSRFYARPLVRQRETGKSRFSRPINTIT